MLEARVCMDGLVEINFFHMRIEWKSYCVYDTHAQDSCSHCDSVRSWTHFHSSLAIRCSQSYTCSYTHAPLCTLCASSSPTGIIRGKHLAS